MARVESTEKPRQWSKQYASLFKARSVVKAYKYRPAYSKETIEIVVELMGASESRRVLDAGCGTGFVARELARYGAHIDVVDISQAAIEEGRRLPGGDYFNLQWIHSKMEEAVLFPHTISLRPGRACIGWIGRW